MSTSLLVVIFALLACISGVFAVYFIYESNKYAKLVWLSFLSVSLCVSSITYIFFIITDWLRVKTILFNIHIINFSFFYYCIYDLILILTDEQKRLQKRIRVLSLLGMFLFSYYFFPFSNYIDIMARFSWRESLITVFELPSFWLFLLYIALVAWINISQLLHYSRDTANSTRMQKASRLLLWVLKIEYIFVIVDYLLRYIFNLKTIYYDISILFSLIFIVTILICQKKFLWLYYEVNEIIHEMMKNIPDIIVILDSNMKPVWYNQKCKDLLSDGEFIDPTRNVQNFILNICRDVVFNDTSKFQVAYTKNGKKLDLLFTVLPLYSKKNHFQFNLFHIQDISSFEKRKTTILKHKKILEQKILAKTILIKRRNLKLKNLLIKKTNLEERNFSILNVDASTELFNRNIMIQKIDSLIRIKEQLYVVYLDIDDVRIFNDLFGYDVIDILITQVADRLKNRLCYDKAVSRFGGDEFLILFDQKTNIFKACNEIHQILSEPFIIDNREIKITVSIGIANYPNDGMDASSLIRFADIAMYEAKSKGKNCISFFASKLKEKLENDFFITEKLKDDLLEGKMKIFCLPIIHFNKNGERKMYALNILGYWSYGFGLTLEDTVFFDTIRKAGILKNFDRMIFKNSIKKYSEYRHAYPDSEIKLLLHLSEKSFYSPIFFEYMLEILSLYSVSPEFIEIEISEETLMYEPEFSLKNIQQCQQLGIAVTIKNFGLTYSSLSYLDKLNISKIKISKFFVGEIGKNIKDEGIVKLFILLAKKLNIKVIAEGVNTVEQLRFLLDHDCSLFEGTLFGRVTEFDHFLKTISSDDVVI